MATFAYELLVLACISGFAAYDVRTRRVPDRVLLLFCPVALMTPFIRALAASSVQPLTGTGQLPTSPTSSQAGILAALMFSLAGAAIGFLTLLASALASKDGTGIGGGDIKLAAAMGFAYGPYRMAAILLAASGLAAMSSLAIILKRKAKKTPCGATRGTPEPLSLPFVPFLAVGSLIATLVRFLN